MGNCSEVHIWSMHSSISWEIYFSPGTIASHNASAVMRWYLWSKLQAYAIGLDYYASVIGESWHLTEILRPVSISETTEHFLAVHASRQTESLTLIHTHWELGRFRGNTAITSGHKDHRKLRYASFIEKVVKLKAASVQHIRGGALLFAIGKSFWHNTVNK